MRQETWTIAKSDWESVEPTAEKFLKLGLADFKANDVVSLTLRSGSEDLSLSLVKGE